MPRCRRLGCGCFQIRDSRTEKIKRLLQCFIYRRRRTVRLCVWLHRCALLRCGDSRRFRRRLGCDCGPVGLRHGRGPERAAAASDLFQAQDFSQFRLGLARRHNRIGAQHAAWKGSWYGAAVVRCGQSEFPASLEGPLRRLPLCLLPQPFLADAGSNLCLCAGSCRQFYARLVYYFFLRCGVEHRLRKQKRCEQQTHRDHTPLCDCGNRQ